MTPGERRGNERNARCRPILTDMNADDAETNATERGRRGPAAARVEAERRAALRRRVEEGYYLTPRMTWELARRLVARGDL